MGNMGFLYSHKTRNRLTRMTRKFMVLLGSRSYREGFTLVAIDSGEWQSFFAIYNFESDSEYLNL